MHKVGLKQAENNALLEILPNKIRESIILEESFIIDAWAQRVLDGTEVQKKNLTMLGLLITSVGPDRPVSVIKPGVRRSRGSRSNYESISQTEAIFRTAAEYISEYDPLVEGGNLDKRLPTYSVRIRIPVILADTSRGLGLPFPSVVKAYIWKLNRIYRYIRKLQVICKNHKLPVNILASIDESEYCEEIGEGFVKAVLNVTFTQRLVFYHESQSPLRRILVDSTKVNEGSGGIPTVIHTNFSATEYPPNGYRRDKDPFSVEDSDIDSAISTRLVIYLEEFIQVAKTLNRLREDSLNFYHQYE